MKEIALKEQLDKNPTCIECGDPITDLGERWSLDTSSKGDKICMNCLGEEDVDNISSMTDGQMADYFAASSDAPV